MRVVATKSFAGNVSMHKGEEREIGSEDTLSYLLKAGYVEILEQPKEETEPEQPKEETEPEQPKEETELELPTEETATNKKGSAKKAGAKNESK